VAVVNEAFVRHFLSGRDPLTARVQASGRAWAIVGVVGDVRQVAGFNGTGPIDALPTLYLPVTQVDESFLRLVHTWFSPSWVVRGTGGETLVTATRRAIETADPQLPMATVRGMDAVRAASVARQRLLTSLATLLGVAALLLAAIGIHGLIAAGVTERTRELGIRLALGATVGQTIRTAALPGLTLTLIGLVLGLLLAFGASGVVRSQLWGVREHDPVTFVGVAIVLLLVATIASLVPALRVRRFDPATLLRE
jgi:hypothetical protein